MSKFYIFNMTGDGPTNLNGREYFNSFKAAQKESERLCRANPEHKIAVMEWLCDFWQDPNPKILNTMPKQAEERSTRSAANGK